ncbi:hypothetical protein DPMN_130255 [Dreissena polymorpha]|uniref:Uncharacterized protein n=1 Tax=Dreissena polymorpha TaxID=45954 RepID=A0A9D4HAP2_DREPO|nr:hypothetical protein DPMN_130255 [Dreissena polymorpha]
MARQRPTRLVMGPCIVEIYRIVMRNDQYQFKVSRCRNEEPHINPLTIDPGFQGFSANSEGGNSGQDGRTAEKGNIIPIFSPKSMRIITITTSASWSMPCTPHQTSYIPCRIC